MSEALSSGISDMKIQDEKIERVVRDQKPKLFNFIKKRVPDRQEAEDILQDVFFELVEAQRLLKPIEQISAWMYRVARNRIIDRFRKRKPVSMSSLQTDQNQGEDQLRLDELLPDPSAGPESELAFNFMLDELSEALEELPLEQREAFVLHELEGLSFREISVQTGVGVNTLLSRKRYAVLFLRERLRHIFDEL